MKIFQKNYEFETVITKGGDKGETSLYSGERVLKYSPEIETVGTIDSLSSYLGIVRFKTKHDKHIHAIQQKLMNGMSVIATKKDSEFYNQIPKIESQDIINLEKWSDKILKDVEIPQRFIIPGEINEISAYIDYARSLCRNAEREIVKFIRSSTNLEWEDVFLVQRYLNRLSDYLFILAREAEQI
jgi:cob(I)alamin adenosyltransferase